MVTGTDDDNIIADACRQMVNIIEDLIKNASGESQFDQAIANIRVCFVLPPCLQSYLQIIYTGIQILDGRVCNARYLQQLPPRPEEEARERSF